MPYKFFIVLLLSLLVVACNGIVQSFSSPTASERFQIQDDLALDSTSGLMWTRCLLGATWNGVTCTGKASSYSWQQAQDLVKSSNYAGFNDWRIPTLAELKTLADKETAAPLVQIPHINQTVFPTPDCHGATRTALHHDGHSCWQWSSTPIKDSLHYIWIVYFGYGYGSANYEADMFALRLVRNTR